MVEKCVHFEIFNKKLSDSRFYIDPVSHNNEWNGFRLSFFSCFFFSFASFFSNFEYFCITSALFPVLQHYFWYFHGTSLVLPVLLQYFHDTSGTSTVLLVLPRLLYFSFWQSSFIKLFSANSFELFFKNFKVTPLWFGKLKKNHSRYQNVHIFPP